MYDVYDVYRYSPASGEIFAFISRERKLQILTAIFKPFAAVISQRKAAENCRRCTADFFADYSISQRLFVVQYFVLFVILCNKIVIFALPGGVMRTAVRGKR